MTEGPGQRGFRGKVAPSNKDPNSQQRRLRSEMYRECSQRSSESSSLLLWGQTEGQTDAVIRKRHSQEGDSQMSMGQKREHRTDQGRCPGSRFLRKVNTANCCSLQGFSDPEWSLN